MFGVYGGSFRVWGLGSSVYVPDRVIWGCIIGAVQRDTRRLDYRSCRFRVWGFRFRCLVQALLVWGAHVCFLHLEISSFQIKELGVLSSCKFIWS